MNLAFWALLLSAALLPAAEPPPSRIDVSGLPAAVVEDVVVPVPSEIFGVLDKLGAPDWKQELGVAPSRVPEDRVRTALLLGSVIADGFVAVEAEDRAKVKDIGRSVLTLAGAIGVRKSVIARSNAIIARADKGEWMQVRRELDGALQDVRAAMIELQDEQLAQLVSLGGWLRGTRVVTGILQREFNPDAAELLHQPLLIDYFSRRLGEMDGRLRDDPMVGDLRARLDEIRPLIGVSDGRAISRESVARIHQITGGLLDAVAGAPPSAS